MTRSRAAKYAVLTEGDGEYASLDRLYRQIHAASEIQLLSPLKVHTTPDAPARRIARACEPALKLSRARGATAAVLLLDRETAKEPAAVVAGRIQAELELLDIVPTYVVLKDRMYENWLIADIESVASLSGRFVITAGTRARVVPDKADHCDALAMLKAAAVKKPYHKVHDAKRICSAMRIERAASNSRSFRGFLQAVGHRLYLLQSDTPAPPAGRRSR